jgi:hypothetical protein
MQADPELIQFTQALIADQPGFEDKIRAIFSFVSQKIRYVAVELGSQTHQPHATSDVFRKRYGDCKDKTTLLLTMLQIAGIEGLPVLVPRDLDLLDESAPTLEIFNHVIAVVPRNNNAYYWLDATNEVAAIDSTPFFKSGKVLLIHWDGTYQFITTPELQDQKDYTDLEMIHRVHESGDIDVEYSYIYNGKAAEIPRYNFKYTSPEERKKIFEKMGVELSSFDVLNPNEVDLPFIIKFQGRVRNHIQKLDEKTMILSNNIPFDSYRDLTTVTARKYPIKLEATFLTKSKFVYYFPEGYKIKALPMEYNNEMPYRHDHIKYLFENNAFTLEAQAKYSEHKISPENFAMFREQAFKLQKYATSVKNIIFEKK